MATVLVGRCAELRTLQRSVDRLERGDRGVVVLQGEAGIGKSRLVAEVLGEASFLVLETLIGTCSELRADLPFAPVADALHLDSMPADGERGAIQDLLHAERPSAQS